MHAVTGHGIHATGYVLVTYLAIALPLQVVRHADRRPGFEDSYLVISREAFPKFAEVFGGRWPGISEVSDLRCRAHSVARMDVRRVFHRIRVVGARSILLRPFAFASPYPWCFAISWIIADPHRSDMADLALVSYFEFSKG
jgi:hypothetical protein